MKFIETIKANKKGIVIVIVVIIVVILLVYWWKKKDENTIVVTEATQEDITKAKFLADRLHEELNKGLFGWSLNSDDDLYMEVAQQSNVVFALVFKYYKEKYDTSLLSALESEWVTGDVITVITDRAKQLKLQ